MKQWTLGAALAATAILAGCGGGGGGDASTNSGPRLVAVSPVPGYDTTVNGSFDLGLVTGGRYYFTDRNNKAVEVYDTASNAFVGSITGFTGCNVGGFACAGAGFSNAKGGPNGINAITGTKLLFVPDVDAVRVVDTTTSPGAIVNTIKFNTTGADAGLRADEGCYDADDKIYMIATPDAAVPFNTFISATTQQIIAKITNEGGRFTNASGNEQCRYDPATKNFYTNNDGTDINPRGEMHVIPASLITPYLATPMPAGTSVTLDSLGPTVKVYPLPKCDPTGLALGPGNDIAAGCRPGNAGEALTVLILDRTNGNILATVIGGGGDQLEYDAATNRYYNASSRWHTSGKNDAGGGCTAAVPCQPVVNIIDAASRTLVASPATGNNAHGLAVDGVNFKVFNPISSAAAPAGCSTCSTTRYVLPDGSLSSFLSGGVAVFATK